MPTPFVSTSVRDPETAQNMEKLSSQLEELTNANSGQMFVDSSGITGEYKIASKTNQYALFYP